MHRNETNAFLRQHKLCLAHVVRTRLSDELRTAAPSLMRSLTVSKRASLQYKFFVLGFVNGKQETHQQMRYPNVHLQPLLRERPRKLLTR